jgi:hypothetical protein
MRTNSGTEIPSEKSHGSFLRFIRNVAQVIYITPKMEGRYAFFVRERSIFNLWQVSIISMAVFYREHPISARGACSIPGDCEIAACVRRLMRYHPVSRELR